MAGLSFCIDEIVKMRIVGEEPVTLLRGAAAIGEDGTVITHGKSFAKGNTVRNFGLNKIMYKHDMNREEVKKLPQMIRGYRPVEANEWGQKIYAVNNLNGNPYVVATTNWNGNRIVSSMYRDDKHPYRALSYSRFQPVTDSMNIRMRTPNGAVLMVAPEKVKEVLDLGGSLVE